MPARSLLRFIQRRRLQGPGEMSREHMPMISHVTVCMEVRLEPCVSCAHVPCVHSLCVQRVQVKPVFASYTSTAVSAGCLCDALFAACDVRLCVCSIFAHLLFVCSLNTITLSLSSVTCQHMIAVRMSTTLYVKGACAAAWAGT
jgi:hypothetical protein